jgi:ferredoxin
MARVRIINSNNTIEVPDGARLLDYVKEEMLFGCESGQCGTCICKIIKGKENLNGKSPSEELLLAKRSAQTNERLACQIWIKKGEVEVEY